MDLIGRIEVKNNAIYLNDGNHSIPLFVWMVSNNFKVGDMVRITVSKGEQVGKDTYFVEESV